MEEVTFEFATTPLMIFGSGSLERLGEHASRLGKRAWLVTGGGTLERLGVLARVESLLAARNLRTARQSVSGEPDTAVVDHHFVGPLRAAETRRLVIGARLPSAPIADVGHGAARVGGRADR